MKLSISKTKIAGEIMAPGSKSHTIRALAFAAMAKGSSIIKAPLVSSDTISSLTAASTMGAWIRRGDDSIWHISGTGGRILEPAGIINMNNSGTGIKLFAALGALSPWKLGFTGDASLRSRPMKSLLTALEKLGVRTESENGKCPFTVQGPILGGETTVNGKSSQYLSALLIAAPLAQQDTVIHVEELNEIPYVELTMDWLKRQNIQFSYSDDYSRFEVKGGQHYKPFSCHIPGDFSSACFPAVAALLTGGELRIDNLDFSDTQGDKEVFAYLEKMGAKIKRHKDAVTILPSGRLHAVEIDMNSTPDALPIMAVAASCAEGISVFKNVAQARIKETDRIHCMKMELEKMGIAVEEFEDGIAVTGGKLCGAHVDSHQDHRIAMSLAVAGFACDDPEDVTVIDDSECIAVTYPGFMEDFAALGAKF